MDRDEAVDFLNWLGDSSGTKWRKEYFNEETIRIPDQVVTNALDMRSEYEKRHEGKEGEGDIAFSNNYMTGTSVDGGRQHKFANLVALSYLDYLGHWDITEVHRRPKEKGLLTEEPHFRMKRPDMVYVPEKLVFEAGEVDKWNTFGHLKFKMQRMVSSNQENKPENYTFYHFPYGVAQNGRIEKVEFNEKARKKIQEARRLSE